MIASVADAMVLVADLRAALPVMRGDRALLAVALARLAADTRSATEAAARPALPGCDERSEWPPCK